MSHLITVSMMYGHYCVLYDWIVSSGSVDLKFNQFISILIQCTCFWSLEFRYLSQQLMHEKLIHTTEEVEFFPICCKTSLVYF